MAIIDVVTYNGEQDMLKLRFNILNEYVNQFVIVESPTTFSGKKKPLYFKEQRHLFTEWTDKILYFVNTEDYTDKEIAFAESSPNTIGAQHWKHEFLQKESILKALQHLRGNDVVFIGDVDEIWDAKNVLPFVDECVYKLRLKVYTYYLNNRSTEDFCGTIVGKWKNIKNKCLNHLRTNEYDGILEKGGWHFTSMGGLEELRRKLSDSYTEETYNSAVIQQNLGANITARKDFLGRAFSFNVDTSEWPEYLKTHKPAQKYLCDN